MNTDVTLSSPKDAHSAHCASQSGALPSPQTCPNTFQPLSLLLLSQTLDVLLPIKTLFPLQG